jgi:hypothetical protein
VNREIYRKILTELGRDQASNIAIYYNGSSETLKILEAKLICNGKDIG